MYQKNERKYLNADERLQFRNTATKIFDTRKSCFCLLMLYTGCRISEALNVKVSDIDFGEGVILFRTLKQRRDDIYRVFPMKGAKLLNMLALTIKEQGLSGDDRLWPVCRTTGWNWIKKAMEKAELTGIKATPKGLRHGFGIFCAQQRYTQGSISKLMGHAKKETTEIYLDFVGDDLHAMVSETWRFFEKSNILLPKTLDNARVPQVLNRIVDSVQFPMRTGSCLEEMLCFGGRMTHAGPHNFAAHYR